MLTQKQNMQLGSVKFLRVIIFSGWNCHFLVRGGSHLLKETLDTVDAYVTELKRTLILMILMVLNYMKLEGKVNQMV